MSLIVSARSMEGTVIAGDTLTTIHVENRDTNEKATIHSSDTIKVFPYLGKFALGFHGSGIIADRTPFFHIMQPREYD